MTNPLEGIGSVDSWQQEQDSKPSDVKFIHSLCARIAELKAALAERDEAMTTAYRLWLQDHHEEVGDYLLPFSTDFRARAVTP